MITGRLWSRGLEAGYRLTPFTLEATTLRAGEIIGQAVMNVVSTLEEEAGGLDFASLRVTVEFTPPPPWARQETRYGYVDVRGSMNGPEKEQ